MKIDNRLVDRGGATSARIVDTRPTRLERISIRSAALTVLATLALFYTFSFAAPILLPIALAIYLNLLLAPLMGVMTRLRIPSTLAAALLVVSVVLSIAGTINLLAEPAQEWLDLTPRNLYTLRNSLKAVKEPLNEIKEITDKVEDITDLEDQAPPRERVTKVAIEKPDLFVRLANQLPTSLTAVGIMVFLTFFLLAASDRFVHKMGHLGRDFAEKRRIIWMVRHIQQDISTYLLTICAINMVLGLATAGCTFLLGFEDPLLWGVLAGVLNFIPYIGPLITTLVLAFVGFISLQDPQVALIAPVFYLVISTLEGQVITPLIIGERLSLSPVTVFIFLVFWGWIWGPLGMLLAIPILVGFRVVFQKSPGLQVLSQFIAK